MSDDQLLHDRAQARADAARPASTAAAGALAAILERRISASLLPADPPLSPAALSAIADFLLETAQSRGAAESAVDIDTVSGPAGSRFMRIAIINEDMPFLVDSIAATVAAQQLEIHRLIHPVIRVTRDPAGRIVHALQFLVKSQLLIVMEIFQPASKFQGG